MSFCSSLYIIIMKFFYLTICFTLWHKVYSSENAPIIEIHQGKLMGYIRETWNGRPIYAFQSIPYAEPPVGNLRFKPPTRGKKWKGTLNATTNHPACPQMDIFTNNFEIFGEEDCLYVNVYTPKISSDLMPVIVYIHGGSFTTDHANPTLYGPDILLDKDLVLVTFNYRLGPLGFLSLENDLLPGNNGLKDQSLAIHWVKDNIVHFGGNPNKLTIAGNSAGGASVYFHMVSPLTKDLLFAAISSSGIATAPWAIAQKGEARKKTIKLGKILNCTTSSDEKLLKCLSKVEARDFVAQYVKFMEFGVFPLVIFPPVLESGNDAFLTELPINTLLSGNVAKIPFMNGITTEDGHAVAAGIYNDYMFVEKLNNNFEKIAPIVYLLEQSNSDQTNTISQFYFNNGKIDDNAMKNFGDSLTDSLLYAPQRIASELHFQQTSQPAYFYVFGYAGSVSYASQFSTSGHDLGVTHCDDLIYVLSNTYFTNYKPSEEDLKMNDIMTTLWYNFANTGNPTPETNSIITEKWEPVEHRKFKHYLISGPSNIKTESKFRENNYKLWKSLNVYSLFMKTKDEL